MSPASDRSTSSPSRMFRRMLLVTFLTTLAPSTGCMTVHNGFKAMTNNSSWNDTVVVLRNRSMATKAWHRRKHHFCDERHVDDFCSGFRAGYEASALGSDGCTPAFPPKNYWSWEFQSAEGQARTAAWFAGYPQGARAAEEDGVSNWTQIPMSAGMQSQLHDAGVFTHQGAVYPIPEPNPAARLGAPTDAYPLGMPTEQIIGVPMDSEAYSVPQ